MNPLQRARIEKAGHDNGFENVVPSGGFGVDTCFVRSSVAVHIEPSG